MLRTHSTHAMLLKSITPLLPSIYPHNFSLRRRQLPTLLRLALRQNLLAPTRVEVAQIAIPAQTNNVHDQHAVLHGHVLEVCKLHPRPDHKILGQAGDVGVLQALLGRVAFEVGHGGEEECYYGVSGPRQKGGGLAREDVPMFTGAKIN
jgi:hypothetical protein